jgi:hypothetical protein
LVLHPSLAPRAKTHAPASRHGEGFVQAPAHPCGDDLFQITGHEADDPDVTSHERFPHGAGDGPADERSHTLRTQILGPLQRLGPQQKALLPLVCPVFQDKDAPSGIKNRSNAILPMMHCDA